MAFGGFFGGGTDKSSSTSSSSSSPSSISSDAPTAQAIFPASATPSSSASSSEIKNKFATAISTQNNIINAKMLIQKINENCFDHCVTAPGSSLSSKENTCLSACMEKYIDAWNTVSRTYVGRLQKEGAQLGLGGAGGL